MTGEQASDDSDCSAQTHLIPRTWPSGELSDRSFAPFMAELLGAVSEHSPSAFDFDDVVALANDCSDGPCRPVCFRQLSVYYEQDMIHGHHSHRPNSEFPDTFFPAGPMDRRFRFWPAYRSRLLHGLRVLAAADTGAASKGLVLLQRPNTRRTINHQSIEDFLTKMGFAVVSATPDYHTVQMMARVISSARYLCAVSSGVGNGVFLPPNSGVLDLQPQWMPSQTPGVVLLSHDPMFVYLHIHHIKYACHRSLVQPLELEGKMQEYEDSELDWHRMYEHANTVPDHIAQFWQQAHHQQVFYPPERISELISELTQLMTAYDESMCLDLDHASPACRGGTAKRHFCFGDELFPFAADDSGTVVLSNY